MNRHYNQFNIALLYNIKPLNIFILFLRAARRNHVINVTMPVRVVVGRGRLLLAACTLEARGTDTAQLPQPGQEGAGAPV